MSWKQFKRLLLWVFWAFFGADLFLYRGDLSWWMSDTMFAFLAGFGWACFCLTLGQYMDKPKTNR
jgi:hypothetical protein